MKSKSKIILLLSLLVLLATQLYAQQKDSVPKSLIAQDLTEKIYIHYDKEYYVAGETIWFKAYLYSNGLPGTLSNNFFLQLIGPSGKVIMLKKYPVTGSTVNGNIDLPDSLKQGNYYIRALTAGMLNIDEAFIYKKNIFIYSPSNATGADIKQVQKILLQFFPESGQLVDGILSVLGFEATDQWGTPVNINGFIKTEDGITIASFKSYHDGIGKVQFKPQAEKKYMAQVETAAGPVTFPLPDVQSSGVNLTIQDEKGGKKFQLSRSKKDKIQFENLLLVAEINNHKVYENEISLEDYSSVIGHLITDSLPSGILHFTVFNKEGLPLAERLSFVDNGEYRSGGEIDITKTNTEKRSENIVELNFPDSIQRSCSVAVIDLPGISLNDNDNIWSRFLLTCDLKGYIHNPAWYFENRNDTVEQALDNLMLTHGWSRFNRTEKLANEFPKKTLKDDYLINISGIVYSESDKKPVEGGNLNVLFSTEDSSLLTYDIPVNENGQFLIDSLAIFGKTKLFYTYTDKRKNEKPVFLETDGNMLLNSTTEPFPATLEKYTVVQPIDLKKPDIARRYEYASNGKPGAKLLENAQVIAKQKRPVDIINEKYTSDLFSTGGKIKIDNINYPPVDKAMNGVDFVLNRIPTIGIQYEAFVNRKNFSIQNFVGKIQDRPGRPRTTVSGPMKFWKVGLFINEIPADLMQLQVLRADQIAMVKFFEAGSIVSGSEYPGGAVAVYLNYETGNEKIEKIRSKYIEFNGYSISKEFYSPDYSVPSTNNNRLDNRTTLYWNPEIFKENMAKTVQLKFFNNDFSKKFKIVVEGFDSFGRLIHLEKIIGD